jgi:hypothetical protein
VYASYWPIARACAKKERAVSVSGERWMRCNGASRLVFEHSHLLFTGKGAEPEGENETGVCVSCEPCTCACTGKQTCTSKSKGRVRWLRAAVGLEWQFSVGFSTHTSSSQVKAIVTAPAREKEMGVRISYEPRLRYNLHGTPKRAFALAVSRGCVGMALLGWF